MNTKIKDWQLIVPRKIHQYLTHYGFTYCYENELYKCEFEDGLCTILYTPKNNYFGIRFDVWNLEDYEKCEPFIKFYYQRKKYLQKKGLIKNGRL